MDINLTKKRLEIAKYIIENEATIEDTAKHFNMSISSIKKVVNNYLKLIDENVYNMVKETQKRIAIKGHTKGGQIGKRSSNYDNMLARKIVDAMLEDDLTIEEASTIFNIPRTTIWELIQRVDDIDIQSRLEELFIRHKKEATKR